MLPSFEDALENAETPAWIAQPKAEVEHAAFDDRAAAAKAAEAAAAKAAAAKAAAAAERSKAAASEAGRAKPPAGGAAGKQPEEKELSMKDRTKEKRKRDQSAGFLGGHWKSDEEMRMRDNFDS